MPKVELSYKNPTSRMRYGAKLIFEFCLGVDYCWVDGDEYEYVVITCGDKSLTSPLHALSFSQDEQALSSGVQFPCEVLGVADLNYDPFASAVFMAARWDEINRGDQLKKDKHNRFEGTECDKPFVELMAVDLAEKLGIKPDTSRYSYQPTIDVDIAFAFKGRSITRSILASVRDFVFLRWERLALRIKVVLGNKTDPYDTYSRIENLHESKGLKSKAFFLCVSYNRPFDVGLSREVVGKLMQNLPKWDVYWHPSYSAIDKLNNDDLDGFLSEKNSFPGESSVVRAHFLRCDARHWPYLVKAGVNEDYSLGYADKPGFKSGMCRPYPAFDLVADVELPLTLHPVIAMDSSLKSYLSLSPNQGVELVAKLNDEVRNVGGQMITLFHNTSVSDFEEWNGWRQAYEEIVDLCSRPNN